MEIQAWQKDLDDRTHVHRAQKIGSGEITKDKRHNLYYIYHQSSMTNCGTNVVISKSMEGVRAKKRRPDRDSIVPQAQEPHGLSIEDGRESVFCLLSNGSIVDRGGTRKSHDCRT